MNNGPDKTVGSNKDKVTYRFPSPVEMPRGTHYGSNYYVFRSRKLGRRVSAFSNIEYWHLVSLEMDHSVEYYCEQPCTVDVNYDGETNKTTFDAWVLFRNGKEEFREVKDYDELNGTDEKAARDRKQIAVQAAWCIQNHEIYRLITDRDLLNGSEYMRNLTYLFSKALRFYTVRDLDISVIRRFIEARGVTTVGELKNSGILSVAAGNDILADLYYRGIIDFPNMHSEPFANTTEVVLNVVEEK